VRDSVVVCSECGESSVVVKLDCVFDINDGFTPVNKNDQPRVTKGYCNKCNKEVDVVEIPKNIYEALRETAESINIMLNDIGAPDEMLREMTVRFNVLEALVEEYQHRYEEYY